MLGRERPQAINKLTHTSHKMITFLLGMPGSGKTTMAKILEKQFDDCIAIGAGDMIRELAASDFEFQAALAAGQMAPRDKTNKMIADALHNAQHANLIIDGFPRYEAQYEIIKDLNAIYIYLACNDSIATERLLARQRGDDTVELVKTRLATFWKETWPMVNQIAINEQPRSLHIIPGTPEFMAHKAITFIRGHMNAGA